jgi:molybdopterin-guanine dinucleotide biosynthesis protein A
MTLAAVLLSGGESRRMGRDKATLLLDGVPLWQRQLGLLRELSPCALLVSARERPGWLPQDVRFVADSAPARGPLGGLAAALEAMAASHLLALPIDLPAMTAAHLAILWGAASPGCGALPWLDDRAEPLPAVYPAEAAPIASGLLAGADVSLRALTEVLVAAGRMKKHVIGSPDSKLYANCNSPADWQRHADQRKFHHD